jgi:hypothetical protein
MKRYAVSLPAVTALCLVLAALALAPATPQPATPQPTSDFLGDAQANARHLIRPRPADLSLRHLWR